MGNKEQNNQKFSQDSKRFWDTIRQNKITIIVSNVLNREINRAPAYVRFLFATLSESQIIQIDSTTESNRLAMQYILEGVVGKTSLNDCRHIAIATIAQADEIVSWNLKHMVGRQKEYNNVNRKQGYPEMLIQNPKRFMEDNHDKI